MSNWSPEDSNLNTLCICCKKATVPLLTILVSQPGGTPGDPFSVPYLNPLVLRKELENIVVQVRRNKSGRNCISIKNKGNISKC